MTSPAVQQPQRTDHSPAPASDDAAIDLLTSLVSIRSISGEESAAVAHLASHMRALGLDASIDEAGNAVGIAPFATHPSEPTKDIVLLGHIDTVPGHIDVRREGDLLYGRGSVDAKGPLATFVMAAARAKLRPGWRLIVIGAVEEESATSEGARFAATQYQPAACIIGEPSHHDGVTLGYKGRLLVELNLSVPCAHSAGPDATAAQLACQWWESLRDYAAQLRPGATSPFEIVQATLRSINTTTDALHETARAVVSFRLPLGVDPHQVEQDCRELSRSVAPVADVTFTGHELAYASPRNTPLVRAFTNAIRSNALSPHLRVKTGTSDMNVVAPVWKCPILAYGPGDSRLDHTPNEHISLPEYLSAINVLTKAIEQLSGPFDVAS